MSGGPLHLDLNKSTEKLRLSLVKMGVVTPPEMELAFDLDVSGSFDDEHRDGSTTALITRLIPWGMLFDPDKKLDVFTFSNGQEHAHYVGEVMADTHEDYVRNNIIGKVPGYNGGTDYSYVLEKNLGHFGWKTTTVEAPKKKGFFGGLLGKNEEAVPASTASVQRRSLVIFVTDGANGDKERTERILAESEARKDGVYFLFLGVSNQGTKFPFIEHLGDRFNNVGFVAVNDVANWVKKPDEEINEILLGEELIEWLKAA